MCRSPPRQLRELEKGAVTGQNCQRDPRTEEYISHKILSVAIKTKQKMVLGLREKATRKGMWTAIVQTIDGDLAGGGKSGEGCASHFEA